MRKPSVAVGFIYALTITLLAFIYRYGFPLYFIALFNSLLGFTLGFKRFKIIILLLLLALWGVFLNALFVSNTGSPVVVIGSYTIRNGVLNALIPIGGRLLAISGAALFFLSMYTPLEIVRGLESELRLPKIITFPLAYGLRLLPVMQRDLDEIRFSRKQRGYRVIPLTPSDVASYLQVLIGLAVERAVWTGIAIELRGFHHRRPRYRGLVLKPMDYLLLIALSIQVLTGLVYVFE